MVAFLTRSSVLPLCITGDSRRRHWIPWPSPRVAEFVVPSPGLKMLRWSSIVHSKSTTDSSPPFFQRGQLCCAFWSNDNKEEVWVNGARQDENEALSSPDTSSSSESCSSKLFKVDWTSLMFDLPKDGTIWRVPWTLQTVFQVMFLWFLAFWLVGSWIIPFVAHTIGFNKDSLTYRGQALYSLVTDVAEGTIGLSILYQCLLQFQPLSREWFPLNWQGKWYIEACLGCLMFPLVNRLSQINLDLLPFPSPLTSSNVEQSIMARDPVATILYAIVVSICAPVWEEVIFRGFLLPSLTRYLPIWASVVVSAFAFSLAHFSIQRLLPLTVLGLIMGIVFVRSRNLLASMLLHSLWNSFVFLDLLR